MWTRTGRSGAFYYGKSHSAHLIGCVKGLLSERRDEQFHQIAPDIPGISRSLKFQKSITFVPRHFQYVFAERNGRRDTLFLFHEPLSAELGRVLKRG